MIHWYDEDRSGKVHVECSNAGSITVLALTCRLRTVPLLALLEQALSSTECILALMGLVNRGNTDRASRTATSTLAVCPSAAEVGVLVPGEV